MVFEDLHLGNTSVHRGKGISRRYSRLALGSGHRHNDTVTRLRVYGRYYCSRSSAVLQ
jgi:hypothetical protein